MTAAARHVYEWLAELLEYPGPETLAVAEAARAALAARNAAAAEAVEAFATFAAGLDARELEELYVRTFDVFAPCCLDVGWQLFGETYKRGAFLVKMRGALRRHGIESAPELPDHLPVVLRLLARLSDEDDPRGLAEEALLPAIAKMRGSFKDPSHPYARLLEATALALAADFSLELPRPALPVLQPAQEAQP